MKSRRTALIAGASGLTGGHLLALLLADPRYVYVHALVRKPCLPPHPRLKEHVFNFDRATVVPAADDVFCCLGTTIRDAGSKEAFRKVDFEYVVSLARRARKAGARRFLIVSALGANADSAVFYSRVKGEAERALQRIGFEGLHIFQPSLLLGNRQEPRTGERIGIAATSFITPLMLGPLRKYRPIEAQAVALAMWKTAWANRGGNHAYTSEAIVELAA